MPATTLVPILARALRDESPEVRRVAASTAGELGRAAGPLVTTLSEIVAASIGARNAEPAAAAAQALGVVTPDRDAVVPILFRALTQAKSGSLRCSAASALKAIRTKDPRVIDALFAALTDRSFAGLRATAADALGVLAKDDRRLVSTLRVLLRTGDPSGQDAASGARTAALEVLGELGPRANAAIPELQQIGCDPKAERYLRTKAIEILGGLGQQALEALAAVDRGDASDDSQLKPVVDAAWLKAKGVR